MEPMESAASSASSDVSQLYEPYAWVMQATAAVLRQLAEDVPGVESLWVRPETRGRAPQSFEVAREYSLVIDVGTVVAVRVHWYDGTARGRSPNDELIYDRVQPTVADDSSAG